MKIRAAVIRQMGLPRALVNNQEDAGAIGELDLGGWDRGCLIATGFCDMGLTKKIRSVTT